MAALAETLFVVVVLHRNTPFRLAIQNFRNWGIIDSRCTVRSQIGRPVGTADNGGG